MFFVMNLSFRSASHLLLIGIWTTKRLFASLQALHLVSQVSCGRRIQIYVSMSCVVRGTKFATPLSPLSGAVMSLLRLHPNWPSSPFLPSCHEMQALPSLDLLSIQHGCKSFIYRR